MKKPIRRLPFSLFLLATLLILADARFVSGQSGPDELNLSSPATLVESLIGEGKQLERQGRWGEALSHYQQALKSVPGNSRISTRRSIARIHFDLARRYSDDSYLQTLSNVDESRALSMYSEVLLKIQSYYVDQPDWDNILRHGLASMEIALSEPAFLKSNLKGVGHDRIQAAVDEMNTVLDRYTVRSRQDAHVIAGNVCRTMQRQLGLRIQTSVYEFVCGAVIALDAYSAFMTSNQYGETMSQIEGNFVGLGVELKTSHDRLEIVDVIKNGPAGRAGITKGQWITSIDGKTVVQLGGEKAADNLRGIDGSFVQVSVQSHNGETRRYRLQRRRVEIPSVERVEMINPQFGIGYIKLTNFQKTTTRDFDAALWKLNQTGMRALIVDLRGNPGGLLNSSVEIADRFLSGGVIVSTRGRNPMEDYVHHAKMAGTWRVPLVVLIDEDSASASEIFAAAIEDHGRGKTVGHRSYGKGSVQGIFPLNVGGGGVRLTTARFYSPKGVAISDRGVTPAVPVQVTAKIGDAPESTEGDDAILRIGLQQAIAAISSPGTR